MKLSFQVTNTYTLGNIKIDTLAHKKNIRTHNSVKNPCQQKVCKYFHFERMDVTNFMLLFTKIQSSQQNKNLPLIRCR